jgi:hypothetical protein
MTATPSPSQNPQPIAEFLKNKGIEKIVIIDDVYDGRERQEFPPEDLREFSEEVLANKDMQEELAKLEIRIDSADEITDEVLHKLWEHRDDSNPLGEFLRAHLFRQKIDDWNQVETIRKLVSDAKLALDVTPLGRKDDILTKTEGASIVFIDYYLGPDFKEDVAVERAQDIARSIYNKYSNEDMPLIILMSSNPRVKELEEGFRAQTKLLRGMFHFTVKDDLENEDKVYINIIAWAQRLRTGSVLQRFVSTVDQLIHSKGPDFIEGIKKLSLEDYAYIHKLSLQEDKHPLGDYMLWLFNSYLGHLIFESDEALRKQRELVDSLKHDFLPPMQTMPSKQLKRMYNSALFDMNVGSLFSETVREVDEQVDGKQATPDAGEVESGAMETVEEDFSTEEAKTISPSSESGSNLTTSADKPESAEGAEPQEVTEQSIGSKTDVCAVLPDLHLGDVFVKDKDSEVYMVINADCDLADALRTCDPDSNVLLIPGVLRLLSDGGLSETRTEFFEYDEDMRKIEWKPKKVTSLEFGEVDQWLKSGGYERYARLRLPFALEVQRTIAAELTRVGLPASPPIYQPVKLQLLCEGEEGKTASFMDPSENFAVTIRTKKGLQCHLTMEFGVVLKKKIEELIAVWAAKRDSLDKSDPDYGQLGLKISNLNSFLKDFHLWYGSLTAPVLDPKGDPKQLQTVQRKLGPIAISKGKTTEDAISNFKKHPVIINVVEADVEIE